MSKTAKRNRKERGLTNKQKAEQWSIDLSEQLNKLPTLAEWVCMLTNAAADIRERGYQPQLRLLSASQYIIVEDYAQLNGITNIDDNVINAALYGLK